MTNYVMMQVFHILQPVVHDTAESVWRLG